MRRVAEANHRGMLLGHGSELIEVERPVLAQRGPARGPIHVVSECTLRTSATAAHADILSEFVTPDRSTYPWIDIAVDLTGLEGGRACSQHPLNGTPAGVTTRYTPIHSPKTFCHRFDGAAFATSADGPCGDVDSSCGNGPLDGDEECDPGVDLGDNCLDSCACAAGYAADGLGGCGYCGDGTLEGNEDCDPGYDGSGNCLVSCQCAFGYAGHGDGSCEHCGDGALNGDEECDPAADGSGNCSDSCACYGEYAGTGDGGCGYCGDGELNGEEACDPNADYAENCSESCACLGAYEPVGNGGCGYCGDGELNGDEECDPDADASGNCTASCGCDFGSEPDGNGGCGYCGDGEISGDSEPRTDIDHCPGQLRRHAVFRVIVGPRAGSGAFRGMTSPFARRRST